MTRDDDTPPDDEETPPPAGSENPPLPSPTLVGIAMGVGRVIGRLDGQERMLKSIATNVELNTAAWQQQGLQLGALPCLRHERRISDLVHSIGEVRSAAGAAQAKATEVAESTGEFIVEERTAHRVTASIRAVAGRVALSVLLLILGAVLARFWR
jgi:hypothetical protein